MSQAQAVTTATFEEKVLKNAKPVLVDFWAEWCGPCRMMGPVLDEIAAERAGVVEICKVNCDDDGDLAAKYDVSGIPCFILFQDGVEIDRRVGGSPKEAMLAWLDAAIA